MDVSDQHEPGGQDLIQQLVTATGLPEGLVHQELSDILRLSGTDSENLTIEQLREAMLAYLEALDSAQNAGMDLDPAPLGAEPLG